MNDAASAHSPKRYLFYPGCALKGTGLAYEESLVALFGALGLPLSELPDWNCCGATSYTCVDDKASCLLAARNLALTRRAGYQDVVVPCNACYLALRKCLDYVKRYPEVRTAVDGFLKTTDLPSFDTVSVRHPLEVVYTDVGVEALKGMVKRAWPAGPVACYYGCQAVRPYEEVDTSRAPTRMDELLGAVGIPTVEYPLKTRCCGGSHTGTTHSVGVRLNYILLNEAVRRGAAALVVICPLCQFNLDLYQGEMRSGSGDLPDIPVFFLPQVLAWSLGADTRALGLRRAASGRGLARALLADRAGGGRHG